jgi:hypothetical protein
MRLDYKEDLIWWILWMILGTVFVATVVFAFTSVGEFKTAIKQVEASTGCEYVGSPKGTGRVGYFDCNGVIETKRIPK